MPSNILSNIPICQHLHELLHTQRIHLSINHQSSQINCDSRKQIKHANKCSSAGTTLHRSLKFAQGALARFSIRSCSQRQHIPTEVAEHEITRICHERHSNVELKNGASKPKSNHRNKIHEIFCQKKLHEFFQAFIQTGTLMFHHFTSIRCHKSNSSLHSQSHNSVIEP